METRSGWATMMRLRDLQLEPPGREHMDLQLVETIIIILDGRRNILDGRSPDLGEAPRARRSRCAAAHATRRSEDPRWGHLAVAKEARRAALQAIV